MQLSESELEKNRKEALEKDKGLDSSTPPQPPEEEPERGFLPVLKNSNFSPI